METNQGEVNFSRKGTLLIAVSCQNQLLSPFSSVLHLIPLADGQIDECNGQQTYSCKLTNSAVIAIPQCIACFPSADSDIVAHDAQ